MAIRFATVDDIPALVESGKTMHALTRFKVFDYDAARVADTLQKLIEKGQGKYVFMVAVDTQKHLVGALIAVLETHIFSNKLTASVMHYDVLPDKRMGGHGVRLLKAFETWCQNRQVFEINLGINSLNAAQAEQDTVGRFIQKMGYDKVGENFVKGGL